MSSSETPLSAEGRSQRSHPPYQFTDALFMRHLLRANADWASTGRARWLHLENIAPKRDRILSHVHPLRCEIKQELLLH